MIGLVASFLRKIIIIILLLLLIGSAGLQAEPEFALWTGNRCSACHTNFQGGGFRREFGWAFGRDAAAVVPEEIGLQSVYDLLDKQKYSYLDGLLAFGADFRLQMARSHKVPDPKTKIFPMQASLYSSLNLTNYIYGDLFQIEGQYNFGPKIFQGQQSWMASVYYRPDPELPAIRIGHFQPSIGLRECDMTSLDRRTAVPDGTENFIAPDFAENGFELIYESLDWLSVNAGAFDSHSLGEVTIFGDQFPLITIKNNPSFTVRSMIYPNHLIESFHNSFLGSSILINGDFLVISGFAGFAVLDNLFLYGKYTSTNKPYVRKTDNFVAGLTYIPLKGIMLGLKGESGKTDLIFTKEDIYRLHTYQAVLNAKILLIPYLELIPEYRFMATEEYKSSRWAFQLHFYY